MQGKHLPQYYPTNILLFDKEFAFGEYHHIDAVSNTEALNLF